MGKSPPINTITLQNLVRTSKSLKPASQFRKEKSKNMESSSRADRDERSSSNATRVPLSEIVSDCVKRWFKDTLKEAKAGDINMQVLVGQMYYSGYGVPRDAQKGRIWMTRASRTRSSVWKVSDKRPGYNASDSDSDELKGDS
ncbi:hypothetical protein HS088_TW03G01105 [Tripterygium wilfordii]|uniref:Uncharacterized protein n=1 Tax=Tripterygium wilfordii TaxID=458696 RepID=A0A7J7DXD8_TRIWF|nr:uncharacterized protein LOC119995682 [Tripterygium wilfordii]XP_038698114.1 uncharacterized protein LOC119995682 [Tripterygium wilfordii]KAF5750766.1 hypothetical protein HS088_TW03G01105 [Tripterygium wilfordii]